MSLINQMLNDLDARRAVGGEALRAHRDVRPLPPQRTAAWRWIAAAGGLVVLSVIATWWFMTYGPGRPLPVLPASLTKQAASAVLPPLVAAAEPATPAVQPASPAAASQQAPVQALVAAKVERPAALPTASPPLPLVSALAKPAQAPSPRAEKPAGKQAAAPSIAPELGVQPAEEMGRIDKQVRATTPQERAESLYRAALEMLAQARNEDALTTIRATLREDPRHVAARQWLIKTYVDGHSLDAAQGVLLDGLAVLPQQTGWALLLSRLQADRADNSGALKTLEGALPYAANSPQLLGALGAVLQRLGRHSEAEQRFAQAIQNEPEQGRWWLGLALAHEAQGEAGDARAAFQRAAASKSLAPDLQAFAEQKLR